MSSIYNKVRPKICSFLLIKSHLISVYKIESHASPIHEKFGKWHFKEGLIDHRSSRVLSRRRRNLMGRPISVSMVLTNDDSINHLTDYR